MLPLASKRLKAPCAERLDALHGELGDSHRFVLDDLLPHIEVLEARMARFDTQLLTGLEEKQAVLQLLQSIPGIDLIEAAMLYAGRDRNGYERHRHIAHSQFLYRRSSIFLNFGLFFRVSL